MKYIVFISLISLLFLTACFQKQEDTIVDDTNNISTEDVLIENYEDEMPSANEVFMGDEVEVDNWLQWGNDTDAHNEADIESMDDEIEALGEEFDKELEALFQELLNQ